MPFFPSLPEDATTAEIFGADPDFFASFLDFSHRVMRGDSPLSVAERELIGAYVSGLNACAYCAGGHRAAAVEFGVDPGLFDRLLGDIDRAPVDDKLRPLLKFLRKLTLEANRVSQPDADAVFAAGWSERALRDAIFVCGLFNCMNRVVKGHGIVPDPNQFAARGHRTATHGYRPDLGA